MPTSSIHYEGKKKVLIISFHILFWVVYLAFFTTELMIYQPERGLLNTIGRLLVSIWVDILAAYFTVYFLIPRFIFRKKYFWFLICFILSAIAIVFLQRTVLLYISYPTFLPDLQYKKEFFDFYPLYSFMNIYTGTAFFASIYLTRFWFINQQQKKDLEQQNIESEMALLRSQISPHFLFNTLNNIDSLIFLNQKWASDAVIKLSEILRYMLYEANIDRVPLETEVSYLKSYVELQHLRIEQEGFVHFDVKGKIGNHKIAPMLLIPFVENAFKHGKKNVQSPGIMIKIMASAEEISFDITNYVNTTQEINKDETRGIGLKNVERRLKLIYPGKHKLVIETGDELFVVQLKISIT